MNLSFHPKAGPAADLSTDPTFFDLVSGSYARIVGETLVPEILTRTEAARWLYEQAPFCLLAHNTEKDPRFIYGNKAVQRCFEYDWQELTNLPSRLSAELPNREERKQLLEMVERQGFISDYQGIRIAKSGRRFRIENTTVWELRDAVGVRYGQAAMFRHWKNL
jgi:MEKHLA domain